MLKQLELNNFKSFQSLTLPLTHLNLLCGANSVGKSSVIQSLLLVKQNKHQILVLDTPDSGGVKFHYGLFSSNGELVKMGNDDALLFMDALVDELSIRIDKHDQQTLLVKRDIVESKWLVEIDKLDTQKVLLDDMREFDWILSKIRYISTNRITPQITYELSDNNSIGIYGQFTAHFLAVHKHLPLPIIQLKHPSSKTEFLLENVSNWLAQISENVQVNAKVINEANQAAITYQYAYGNSTTREITPLNVGFGVTHVLPIVTLLLTAQPDDILIIENPEAQLHPSGQAKLAELMSLVATNGVQLIVETHSDHIINGVRVATKNKVIAPEQSCINFFYRKEGELATAKEEIRILPDGSVDKWPQGFFDEWDNQLDKLLW